jgi:PAS domain S-box-containing protein
MLWQVPRRVSPQLLVLLMVAALVALAAIGYAVLLPQRQAPPRPAAVLGDPAVIRTIVALGFGLLMVIAFWQVRTRMRIAREIRILAVMADRLRRGDANVRSGLDADPEDIGTLARALDALAVSIERERADVATQERVQRLPADLSAAVLDAEPHAVVLMDHLGRITEFNRSAERLFRYARADVLGRPMAERLVPPLLRHRHLQSFQRYMTTGEATILDRPVQFTAMRADGSEFPVELTVSRVNRDTPPMFVAFIRDITEQTRAEAALRESKERLRLMIAGVQDYAIYLVDPDGRVTSWNPGAERIKGYTAEEIIGAPISRFYTPEDIAWLKPERALESAAATGKFEDEGWRLRKDGSRFWASVLLTALRDETGRLRGFVKVVRDVTARRDAELALRSRELELQRSNALITALARVSARIAARADPDAVFETLGAELRNLEMTCAIATLREGADKLFVRYMSVTPTAVQVAEKLSGVRMRDFPIPRERFPLFGPMIDRGEAGWVPDGAAVAAQVIPWIPGPVVAQVMRAVNMPPGTPAIYAPLEVESRAIGFISVWGPNLQQRDVPALTVFAGQVAATLEHTRLFEDLRANSERARTTVHRLVERQDARRQRIAQQLYEEVAPRLEQEKPDLATPVRDLALTLWPVQLEADGFVPALQWLMNYYTTRESLKIAFTQDGLDEPLDPALQVITYLTVQDALENVSRHAQTSAADVRVVRTADTLSVQVEDRGAGFNPQAVAERGERGLAGLRERIATLGGQLLVESSVGRGTRIRATLPAGQPSAS